MKNRKKPKILKINAAANSDKAACYLPTSGCKR